MTWRQVSQLADSAPASWETCRHDRAEYTDGLFREANMGAVFFTQVAYTVIVSFTDSGVADEWLRWLFPDHLRDVLAAGALDAEVVELEGAPRTFEVRYHFASRDAFARYEQDHAPRLRAAGLKLFPPERGITYRRSLGAATVAFN